MNIPVIDENLNAVKKGLRMKVDNVQLDDDGCVERILVRYTQRGVRGGLMIEVANKKELRGAIEVGR